MNGGKVQDLPPKALFPASNVLYHRKLSKVIAMSDFSTDARLIGTSYINSKNIDIWANAHCFDGDALIGYPRKKYLKLNEAYYVKK